MNIILCIYTCICIYLYTFANQCYYEYTKDLYINRVYIYINYLKLIPAKPMQVTINCSIYYKYIAGGGLQIYLYFGNSERRRGMIRERSVE